MLYLVILSTSGLVAVAVVLWWRVQSNCQEARQKLTKGEITPYLDSLAQCVQDALDESLLVEPPGLVSLLLRFREHQDPYTNLAEILVDIAQRARTGQDGQYEALIKATYQVGYTLNIPLTRLDRCLDELVKGLQSVKASRPIVFVQRISPGELVDARTMVPLNYGSHHVVYPMGVVAFDAEGKVVSRARILCS